MSTFITTKQAAEYLNCTRQHLYNLRTKRKSAMLLGDKNLANKLAPEAIKIGGRILYEESALETWLRTYGEVA
ncbi:helix-turn-helix transcriptional regulator [Alteromonas halophila]|nr:helix-turn-helix domain-containing protein [Alteromonas halophila]